MSVLYGGDKCLELSLSNHVLMQIYWAFPGSPVNHKTSNERSSAHNQRIHVILVTSVQVRLTYTSRAPQILFTAHKTIRKTGWSSWLKQWCKQPWGKRSQHNTSRCILGCHPVKKKDTRWSWLNYKISKWQCCSCGEDAVMFSPFALSPNSHSQFFDMHSWDNGIQSASLLFLL